MKPLLSPLLQDFKWKGSIPKDAAAFLKHHKHPKTARHSKYVAKTAVQLAQHFGEDQKGAAWAGWLHDISAVFPVSERLHAAQQLGLEFLPEEEEVPLLLHQKISVVIANQLFQVQDQTVLDAIGCHTTLRSQPSQMDLVLFVADKISWDQKGSPPYAAQMEEALSHSLEEAAWVYQNFLWHSGKVSVIHPWMRASYLELQAKFG